MAGDDDLAALLPDPPPPRPDRRESAIGAALRRFDGVDEPRSAAQRPAASPRPSWTRPSRGQIGAFASIALVAVIGLPVALVSIGQLAPPAEREARPPADDVARAPAAPDRPPAVPAPKAAPPAAPPTPMASSEVVRPPAAPPTVARPAAAPPVVEGNVAPAPPPPPPPPPAPPPLAESSPPEPSPAPPAMLAQRSQAPRAEKSEASADIVVAARRRAQAEQRQAPVAAFASEAADEGIVVTGMRVSGAARAGRGDWNACTVNDPSPDIARCKHLVDPGAKGERGRAAAHLADGLSRVWRGDDRGSIAAFDQAIALDRRYAFAWLNRGLAHQRRGEIDRAIADLDQAVRYAPGAARGYYNRAQLLRARGDERRASADESRAVRLDRRYRTLVE